MTPRAATLPMSEDQLLTSVLDLVGVLGLHAVHFRPALDSRGRWRTPVQGDGKGWPDLTIVGPHGGLFRELKQEDRYPTVDQRAWIERLTNAGFDASWWRPRDWHSGRVERELRAISRHQTSRRCLPPG